MKNPETLFLKVVVILLGIPILAVCVYWLPVIASEVAGADPEWASWQTPVFIGMYASAIVYFVALYQSFRLLSYIDKNNAFSERSVRALTKIKYCAISISIIHAAVLPFLSYGGQELDPPFPALGTIIICASLVIAVFAAVLQKLLKNAIDIKSENDLTV